MVLSLPMRLLLGLLSVAPAALILWAFSLRAQGYASIDGIIDKDGDIRHTVHMAYMAAIAIWLAMTGFYAYYLSFTERMRQERKVFWIVMLLLFPTVALISFWFRHVIAGVGDPRK